MMSDIDEEVRESIVGSFVDDTKVSKAIKSVEDKTELQRDLNVIYKWAEECRTEFNGNKFEQMMQREMVGVEYIAYITSEGKEIEIGESYLGQGESGYPHENLLNKA